MTIIVGYKDPKTGEVWIGADSRVTSDHFIWPEKAQKISRVGLWTIAISGSAMTKRLISDNSEALAAMTTPEGIWDFLRGKFGELGYKVMDDYGPRDFHQEIIVANKDHVWLCSCNGVVSEMGFIAAGSGDDYAFGAAHAFRDLCQYVPDMEDQARLLVTAAVEAAIAFDSGCGGEVVVEQVR